MIALDTNIFIYACDKAVPARQQIALDLIADTTDGVILWQVACEFIAATRKLERQGFTPADAWARLSEFMGVCRLVIPTGAALQKPPLPPERRELARESAECPWSHHERGSPRSMKMDLWS